MSLFAEHTYNRVMVFIDYRNVFEAIAFAGDDVRVDFYRMTQILVSSRDLVGAYIFDARPRVPRADDTTLAAHDRLREQGFRVIARESLVFRDGKTVQKEVDVSLACELLEHALLDHYDVAIVVSGDRDFVPAFQRVQAAGKRVEVASFKDIYNDECRRIADVYYYLDKMPILSMSSPTADMGVGYHGR